MTITWQKKYRWVRTWGKERGLDGNLKEDFAAYDGETNIGRVYLDQQTLKRGEWRWAIQYPQGGMPRMPNFGYEKTAPEAAKMVEDIWDEQKERLSNRLSSR